MGFPEETLHRNESKFNPTVNMHASSHNMLKLKLPRLLLKTTALIIWNQFKNAKDRRQAALQISLPLDMIHDSMDKRFNTLLKAYSL